MRIAVFSDCYLDLTGGIVSSINAQKKALESRGHEVCVFSTAYPKTPEEVGRLARENIFVVPSCRWCLRGLTPVSRRPKIVERWLEKEHPELKDFDVFYVHYEAGCSIAGLRLAHRLGIPAVQVMHGREDMGVSSIIPWGFRTIVGKVLNWLHARFVPHPVRVKRDDYLADSMAKAAMWTMMVNHANCADLVLTPSEHFRKKLMHYGVTKPVKVFPNGYPDDKFPPKVEAKELKPGETLKLIWHSRVQGEKRIMPFLDALRILRDSLKEKEGSGISKFTLEVFGGGGDLKKAQKYAKKYQLPVKFYGDKPFRVVQPAILKAHLDVLVSYNYDTFGMTLIEAEACGVPALMCDKDLVEVIPRGGFLLAGGPEPEDITAVLHDVILHPEKIRQMSLIMIEHRREVLISKRMELLERYFLESSNSRG